MTIEPMTFDEVKNVFRNALYKANTPTELIQNILTISYEKGYDEGVKDGQKGKISEMLVDTYTQGLNDAWECAKKIASNQIPFEVFGLYHDENMNEYSSPLNKYETMTASEAINVVKKYEGQKDDPNCKSCKHYDGRCLLDHQCYNYSEHEFDEIKLYDEVIITKSSYGYEGHRGIVIKLEEEPFVRVLLDDNTMRDYSYEVLEKTGKSYPELENILEQLKGVNNE